MRILYVNWAPIWYGVEVGGGVNLYSQSMAVELARRGHSVYTVSSGFAYSPNFRTFLRKAPDYHGVKNYEIFNSPILAPAFFYSDAPQIEISCPPLENIFRELIADIKPQVVHFHNIEGFSANCIGIAKVMGAKVIYSLHNYHLICNQVGLLYQGKVICQDFEEGKKCLSCFSSPSIEIERRKRQLAYFFYRLPLSGRIQSRLLQMARIVVSLALRGRLLFRKDSRLIFRQLDIKTNLSNKTVVGDMQAGKRYAVRRQKMIDAINQIDLILAVSDFVKELFIEMGVNPSLVQVNHIGNKMAEIGLIRRPFSSSLKKPNDPVRLIFLGVADELKGLPFVLKTLKCMDNSILQRIELYLYARGIRSHTRSNRQLSAILRDLKDRLAGLYVYDGYAFDELPDILSGMDMGIVPPIWYDNAPQVVFEMFAMKVPVLGARIGGIPNFVKNNENGILFEPGCSEDLKEKLTQVILHPESIQKLKYRISPMKTLCEHAHELESFYGGSKLKKRCYEDDYHKWLKKIAPDPATSAERIQSMRYHPLFSIVLPTYNSNIAFLKELIDLISNQTYTNFEVCICDDGSNNVRLINYLKKLSDESPKFKLVLSKKNRGIASNTNQALDIASGDFVVFCDHDDRIEPFALEMFALYINKFPDAEMLYSDEDMMDKNGWRHSPRLQPDWNPDMFTSHMYFMHIICCKKSVIDRIGHMNPELDGAQDYDFFLRVTEKIKNIVHVPMILYSWRIVPDSLAADPTAKMYAYRAGTKALEDALERRNEDAVVIKAQGAGLGVYRVKRKVKDACVSHIVEGISEDVLAAVKSIRVLAQVPVELIVVIDETSRNTIKMLSDENFVKVVPVPKNTKRATKYNIGAKHASFKNLIFSAENIEVLNSEYPLAMLEHTQRSEIGAVGVKLTYPNGKFYHTGMILGVNGVAGYAYRNIFQGPGHWRYAVLIRNFSAVSWDFVGVDKDKFNEVGGFDEHIDFYEDVDFCLKLIKRGYRNLYTPYVEGVLKRRVHSLEELRNKDAEKVLMERYGDYILNDPSYHPLHTKVIEDFSID
jgi:glycosyltransferase involved in cell wall biosynthesis